MAEEDFTTPSGATHHVSSASFAEAMALVKGLLKSLGGVKIGDNILKDTDVTAIKDALVNAATSEEVESAVMKCLARSTYNGIRITPALFDEPKIADQIRQDYYVLAQNVVKVNAFPFFGPALSALTKLRQTAEENRKQQSPQTTQR